MEDYSSLGEHYAKAFRFLRANSIANLPDGRHEIDGNAIFANISTATTRAPLDIQLENHHNYADLQMVIEGEEYVYVDYSSELTLKEHYCVEKDIEFYSADSKHTSPLLLTPGRFLLLWPGEAHAPCVSVDKPQTVRRLVVKIQVAF